LSADGLIVRPDGKISLPGLADIPAAGMTPVQLAAQISERAAEFGIKPPGATATVIVKEINSRKVSVIGLVGKPGSFPLIREMNVMQAIGEAGGFLEDANKSDVKIVRFENGKENRYTFNYKDFLRGKNLQKNIQLLPGDMILVR
jgi:polysaccharide export outer membrane protein